MSLQWVAEHFEKMQIILIVVAIFVGFFTMRSRDQNSKFKVREADRDDLNRLQQGEKLADAKLNRRQTPPPRPLALPGLQMHGEPHEILGIRENATELEVMKAYKEAIKQYHPDRIQGQAKEQMQFYQAASAQINQAKEKMLAKLRR
jgi:DnaJ-class molecular chaperone